MQRAANGTSGDIWDGHSVEWKRVHRTVKNLRQRIFRASRAGDLKRVRSLQRLMLKSRANVVDSVRRVTQVNRGQSKPGVEQVVVTTTNEKGRLCQPLRHLALHPVDPVRRVYIPKRKGQRPLGIPAIVDRCVQAMVKNALKPYGEARFEGRSYGFRPGRGGHDAITQVFLLARPNTTRPWVLDADIEGAFNNSGHAALVQAIGNCPARKLIQQWLQAGYVEDEMLHPTETGVPQGGGISPWVLNVARHGMEHALGCAYTAKGVLRGTYALVRYADDCAVFCPTQEKASEAQATLADWLGRRGWRLAEAKTHMRPLQEGFNFLGFTIRHYAAPNSSRSGYKLLIKPSQASIQPIKRTLKGLWRKQVGSPTVGLINEMNPVIRGWSNYFRIGGAKQVCIDLDDFMYWRAQRYMKRRPPTKAGWWRTQKYRGYPSGARRDRWVFMAKDHNATLRQFAWTRIVRHRLVPTTSSPDDPALQD